MKYTFRIPTEMYAYIEAEYEGTPEDAVTEYRNLTNMVKVGVGEGLEAKEFNRVLDEYLKDGTIANGADLYAAMNYDQQKVIQEIKKSHKRTNQ